MKKTVAINSDTYHAITDLFFETFVTEMYPAGEDLPGKIPRTSYQAWNLKNPKTGKVRVLEIWDFCTKNAFYLYTRRSEIKDIDGRPTKGSINAEIIGRTLLYLGGVLPKGLNAQKGFWSKKAAILIRNFEAKTRIPDLIDPEADHLSTVKALVERFYNHLAIGETKEAWNCLSQNFQKREIWDGDFDRFHDGFATTLALRDVCAFNMIQIAHNIVECMIFYEDEVSTYPIEGILSLQALHVSELDAFIATVKKIQGEIESRGGKGFDRIPLRKLFDPTGMEFIWYECGFKGYELHKHFAKPSAVTVLRVYHCSCIFKGNEWVINNITPKQTYAIR